MTFTYRPFPIAVFSGFRLVALSLPIKRDTIGNPSSQSGMDDIFDIMKVSTSSCYLYDK